MRHGFYTTYICIQVDTLGVNFSFTHYDLEQVITCRYSSYGGEHNLTHHNTHVDPTFILAQVSHLHLL